MGLGLAARRLRLKALARELRERKTGQRRAGDADCLASRHAHSRHLHEGDSISPWSNRLWTNVFSLMAGLAVMLPLRSCVMELP